MATLFLPDEWEDVGSLLTDVEYETEMPVTSAARLAQFAALAERLRTMGSGGDGGNGEGVGKL